MSATYDVIVVGGGAIGAAAARELARAGRRVLVLDRGGAIGQAWRAAAGMLAPQVEAHGDDPLFRLGLEARERYAPLAAELRDATGIDIGLWQDGIVQVARNDTDIAELRSKVAWQQAAGQPCEWLAPDEVRARWPGLGPSSGALWAAREGALEPEPLVHALLADARRCGAAVIEDDVVRIERRGDHAVGVAGRNRHYAGGEIVLAAGAWSGQIAGVPRTVPVLPVRGQMVALPWPAALPRTIVFSRDGYVLPRRQEAIAGSTMEYAGFLAETTDAGLAGIVAAATALCPSLVPEVHRHWAGLRPMTADGLPIIGADPYLRGLWYATGHGRNGILLAGITGEIIHALIDDTDVPVDIAPFSPARFATPLA